MTWIGAWGECGCGARWTGYRPEHCTSCHQTFSATASGDLHRVGKHDVWVGPNRRRCLTPDEMLELGMVKNKHGYWITRPRDMEVSTSTNLSTVTNKADEE